MKDRLLYISLLVNVVLISGTLFALHRYGGWKNLQAKINNRGTGKTYFHRKNLFEEMPGKDSSIVFLGNSITAQGEWAELFDNPLILNRGIPGDHCDGVRARLDELEKLNPSKLFLMIGINDLAYHPPGIVFEKYTRLIDELLVRFPATTIYLQSVLPINNLVSRTPVENADIQALNENIKQLAVAKQLVFIDLYYPMLDADGNLDGAYTLDGIHLNGKAYLKWKEMLLNYEL